MFWFSVAFASLNASSVAEITPTAPPAVLVMSRSPRLCTVGSLNLPTSQEAEMNTVKRGAFVSVPTSVSSSTRSSASWKGLPWPT